MFVVWMRFNSKNRDLPAIRPIGPKDPTGCRGSVFQVRFKYFESVFGGQGVDFMCLQDWDAWDYRPGNPAL